MIRKLFSFIALALLPFIGLSCNSLPEDSGPGRPYAPRVSMPDYSELNSNEKRYLPQVEDAVVQAGLRPTNGDAEYRLEIELEDGPVNADSTLILYRGSSEISRSYARVGGPSIIFSRARIVQESFEKCLRDFEGKLPRSYGGSGGRYEGGGNRYNDQPRGYSNPSYDGGGYQPPRDYNSGSGYNSQPADWQRGY